jgi:hypothetical protein
MAKSSKSIMSKVGVWSYIAGIIIAAIVGIVSIFGNAGLPIWAVGLLAVLGVIVGLLNISDDEVQQFLLASIAFVVASSGMAAVFGSFDNQVFDGLQVFMSAVAIFTAPGALVVAFKALYQVASDD